MLSVDVDLDKDIKCLDVGCVDGNFKKGLRLRVLICRDEISYSDSCARNGRACRSQALLPCSHQHLQPRNQHTNFSKLRANAQHAPYVTSPRMTASASVNLSTKSESAQA
jgi:hypothetical protein